MPTLTFFSDPHPETTSIDGYCERTGGLSWSDTRDGAGTFADSGALTTDTLRAGITSVGGAYADEIQRMVLLFDTSSLPNTAVISQASLNLYRDDSQQSWGGSVVVCGSSPASNVALDASDYSNFADVALSDALTLGDLSTSVYHSFPLNALGIAAINLTGITKLGIRMLADLLDSDPVVSEGVDRFWVKSREFGGLSQGPYLAVTYEVPGIVQHYGVGGTFDRQNNIGTFGRLA